MKEESVIVLNSTIVVWEGLEPWKAGKEVNICTYAPYILFLPWFGNGFRWNDFNVKESTVSAKPGNLCQGLKSSESSNRTMLLRNNISRTDDSCSLGNTQAKEEQLHNYWWWELVVNLSSLHRVPNEKR